MKFPNVQMEKGNVLSGEKIGELAEFIINKFSQEELSVDEAKEVLGATERVIGEYSKIVL